MSCLTNPNLFQFVACPQCGGDLIEDSTSLYCNQCSSKFEVMRGIPLLYPSGMDPVHLYEEENLAAMTKSDRLTPKEKFSAAQWEFSKQEFWSMVERNIQPPSKAFINIGCGYDNNFSKIQNMGNTFINFDMVYKMLFELQDKFKAKSCVAGDITNLPFKKGKLDYVISIDVLHHESEKLTAILVSFRDLLKNGGILFLEDPNAWGIFQMAKSIFLPIPVYRRLRSIYHRIRKSSHRPADYESPTNVWGVVAILKKLGFEDIKVYPHIAYPCISKTSYQLYKALSTFDFIRKFHNYHYMISATKC